jgi:hypothetical protein
MIKRIPLVVASVLAFGPMTAARAETAGPAAGGAPTEPPAATASGDVNTPPDVNPAPSSALTAPAPHLSGYPTEVPPQSLPAPSEPTAGSSRRSTYPNWMTKVGAGLLLGGGFEDFTNDSLRGMTSGGGYWNARAVAGTRQYVGVEAAYVGAARSINTLGISSNAGLVSNGVEGALRVNVPLPQGRSLIEPFGFVGLGWQHYSLTNTNVNNSDIADSDDVMTLPYGGGLEFSYGMFMADARFTYRQTYRNDLLRTTGGNLNNWGLGAQLGVEF